MDQISLTMIINFTKFLLILELKLHEFGLNCMCIISHENHILNTLLASKLIFSMVLLIGKYFKCLKGIFVQVSQKFRKFVFNSF
jgi:hypothetical protein